LATSLPTTMFSTSGRRQRVLRVDEIADDLHVVAAHADDAAVTDDDVAERVAVAADEPVAHAVEVGGVPVDAIALEDLRPRAVAVGVEGGHVHRPDQLVLDVRDAGVLEQVVVERRGRRVLHVQADRSARVERRAGDGNVRRALGRETESGSRLLGAAEPLKHAVLDLDVAGQIVRDNRVAVARDDAGTLDRALRVERVRAAQDQIGRQGVSLSGRDRDRRGTCGPRGREEQQETRQEDPACAQGVLLLAPAFHYLASYLSVRRRSRTGRELVANPV
jgi:hypothetical protein